MQPQHHQTLAVATWKAALMNLRLRFITGVETSARIKQDFFFLEVNKTVQTLESSGCKGHCSLLKWSFLLIVGVMLWKAQLIKYNVLMQTPTLFLCFYYREHSFRKY